MATPPPELDPEVVLELKRLAVEQLAAHTGAGTTLRTIQAIATAAYRLGLARGAASACGPGGRVVSVRTYASAAGVTDRHVRRLARAGRIPARRHGRDWLIEIEEDH